MDALSLKSGETGAAKRIAIAVFLAGLIGAVYLGMRGSGRAGEENPPASITKVEAAPAAVVEPSPELRPPAAPQRSQPEPEPEPVLSAQAPAPSAVTPADAHLPRCPARAPLDKSVCEIPNGASVHCGYGEGAAAVTCDCDATGDEAFMWRCRSADAHGKLTVCPSRQPAEDTACTLSGHTCFYGEAESAVTCRCGQEQRTWKCTTQVEWAGERHF